MAINQEQAKLRAAVAGANFVHDGMILGLGSGSTAELFVRELGNKIARERLDIQVVATSERTALLAAECGIRLIEPETVECLDLVLDGADEVDSEFRMIKGRGGALLREKIVASAARTRVIMVDRSKVVHRLGAKHALPVEISTFGHHWTCSRLKRIVSEVRLRTLPNGEPFRTDGGNWIADLKTGEIEDPVRLEASLLAIPGVYETGLFVDLCDTLIVADDDNVEILRK